MDGRQSKSKAKSSDDAKTKLKKKKKSENQQGPCHSFEFVLVTSLAEPPIHEVILDWFNAEMEPHVVL